MPKSQHTTQHELLLLLRACRTASLRRSTSTTSTVVSSLSRPNLAGMSVQTSARPGRRVGGAVGAQSGGAVERRAKHVTLARLPRPRTPRRTYQYPGEHGRAHTGT